MPPLDIRNLPAVIAICSFLSVMLIFYGAYHFIRIRQRQRELSSKLLPGQSLDSSKKGEIRGGVKQSLSKPLSNLFSKVGKLRKAEESQEYTKYQLKFQQAGWRSLHAFATFWGAKIFFLFTCSLVFAFTRLSVDLPISQSVSIIALVIVAFIGFNLPNIWLKFKIQSRKKRIFQSFPDALDLMVICVEAGMALDAAIHRVGLEMQLGAPEISEEFKLVNLELRTGKPRPDCLRNLALRVDLQDVRNLVTLLIQTDKFGTSVTKALRVYSDSFRTKRQQRAEERAAKLPVKIIFVAMIFIFPVLYVVTLGPAILNALKAFS